MLSPKFQSNMYYEGVYYTHMVNSNTLQRKIIDWMKFYFSRLGVLVEISIPRMFKEIDVE